VGFGNRGGGKDSQDQRLAALVTDLTALERCVERVDQQLEIVRRSLSNAPTTSQGWTFRLLLGQALSGATTLRTCTLACLELAEVEVDLLPEP